MKEAGNDCEAWFIAAGPGWSDPKNENYNPTEDKEAWKVALPFLIRIARRAGEGGKGALHHRQGQGEDRKLLPVSEFRQEKHEAQEGGSCAGASCHSCSSCLSFLHDSLAFAHSRRGFAGPEHGRRRGAAARGARAGAAHLRVERARRQPRLFPAGRAGGRPALHPALHRRRPGRPRAGRHLHHRPAARASVDGAFRAGELLPCPQRRAGRAGRVRDRQRTDAAPRMRSSRRPASRSRSASTSFPMRARSAARPSAARARGCSTKGASCCPTRRGTPSCAPRFAACLRRAAGADAVPGELTAAEAARAADLERDRYSTEAWNRAR